MIEDELNQIPILCDRCGKRTNVAQAREWAMRLGEGRIVAVACTGCQTAEEHLSAEVYSATADLGVVGDRFVLTPKVGAGS